MLGVAALIGFILVAFLAYKYLLPLLRKREAFNSRPQVTVAYYFMPGCGHCETFDESGEWTKLTTEAPNAPFAEITTKRVNGTVAANVDPAHKDIVSKGFPAIVIDKGNGVVTSHDKGPRTSDAILESVKAFVAA
jgi:hypothetical protein